MLIALLIIGYILIACIVGCAIYVFYDDDDSDIASILGGTFWPLALVFISIYKLLAFFCNNICKVFKYLKNEGFHYCREDIKPCCGQCKYMFYYNDHNELNGCYLKKAHSNISTETTPCSQFRKHWLWRFRIRYKWNDNLKNK